MITDVVSVENAVDNSIFTSIADNITSNYGPISQPKAAGINSYCTYSQFDIKLNIQQKLRL